MLSRFIFLGVSAVIGLAVLAGCNQAPARTNAQVAAEVQNKISSDSRIRSREIGVQAENVVVTLTGNVTSDGERASASDDAATIHGVKTVVNNLIVQQSEEEVAGSTPPEEVQKPPKKEPQKIAKSMTAAKADTGPQKGNDAAAPAVQNNLPAAPTSKRRPISVRVPSGTPAARENTEVKSSVLKLFTI